MTSNPKYLWAYYATFFIHSRWRHVLNARAARVALPKSLVCESPCLTVTPRQNLASPRVFCCSALSARQTLPAMTRFDTAYIASQERVRPTKHGHLLLCLYAQISASGASGPRLFGLAQYLSHTEGHFFALRLLADERYWSCAFKRYRRRGR